MVSEIDPDIEFERIPIPFPFNYPLEIKKGFGTYCQGEVWKKHFCLTFIYNTLFESVWVYIAGNCEPIAPFSLPVMVVSPKAQLATTGNVDEYALTSGTYVAIYAQFSLVSPPQDLLSSSCPPVKAVIKKFQVIDANNVKELDAWSCNYNECKNIHDVLSKMCMG